MSNATNEIILALSSLSAAERAEVLAATKAPKVKVEVPFKVGDTVTLLSGAAKKWIGKTFQVMKVGNRKGNLWLQNPDFPNDINKCIYPNFSEVEMFTPPVQEEATPVAELEQLTAE